MARKIFVSYKHSDSSVPPLNYIYGATTARNYVDLLELQFEDDHIYKGEKDNEDLGSFKDETIGSHLRDKIFDSSVTIILISKNMKEYGKSEDEQWIPWEISYSMKEKTRDGRTSTTNAMLAVVLPDENGNYQYFIEQNPCVHCNSITWKTNTLFNILSKNMFNRNQKKLMRCANGVCGRILHTGDDHSYIHPVRWDHFIRNRNIYIELAVLLNENIDQYDITKVV